MKAEGGIIFNKAITHYPASGNRNRDSGAFNVVGTYGYAWSSAVTGTNAYNLRFLVSYVSPQYDNNRANGFPVRCVQYLHFLGRLSDRNYVNYGFRKCIKVNSVIR